MRRNDDSPLISVVVPVFDEADTIAVLVDELATTLQLAAVDFEIILVDDGSRDATWQRIVDANARLPEVKGLSLLRNFGHQGAMLAGLAHASGRAVVTMDGDLQHPPALIPRLLAAWREGYRVVHTQRRDGAEAGWFKRRSSRLFYRLFSFLSGIEIPPGSSDFRLLDATVVDQIVHMRDPDPFLRGMVRWLGAEGVTLEFDARPRAGGKTKFGLGKMLRLAASGVVSFSTVPLRVGIWLGLITSVLAFAEIVYIAVQVWRGQTVPGWASLLTVVSFMFGVLFILLGVVGLYLASIHRAVRNRPPFLVGESIGVDDHGDRRKIT